jgi:reactive intermediate/imine deaminase
MNRLGLLALFLVSILAQARGQKPHRMTPKETVRQFLETVRSGRSPERALDFMTDTLLAHQLNAENQETIRRTPQNYTEHVREFLRLYGKYDFKITELIAENDKVYARWIQTGRHEDTIDQYPPTHLPLTEIGSAVYRVVDGKIAEYWILLDRLGFERQLEKNRKETGLPFSEARSAGHTLYISGQVGTDASGRIPPDSSFRAEARQVMENIGRLLQEHQLRFDDLVNVTIYLTDMAHYSETNEIYRQYFPSAFPARVCIAVKELPLHARIEISGVANLK